LLFKKPLAKLRFFSLQRKAAFDDDFFFEEDENQG